MGTGEKTLLSRHFDANRLTGQRLDLHHASKLFDREALPAEFEPLT